MNNLTQANEKYLGKMKNRDNHSVFIYYTECGTKQPANSEKNLTKLKQFTANKNQENPALNCNAHIKIAAITILST